MPPAGFEAAIPASERSQTHALDRAATGIGTVDGDTNMDEHGYTLRPLQSYLLFSWKKMDMIVKPSTDRGRKLTTSLEDGTDKLSETSVRDYHSTLRTISEDRRYQWIFS
jgi:hypothetical protein